MNMSVYQVSLVFPCQVAKAQAHDALLESEAWAPGHLGTWADLHYVLQLEAADAELLGAREQCEAKWRNHEKSCFDFWCRFQTKIVINQDPRNVCCPCDSEAIWLYLCAVKPQRAWFCEFCRFAAEMEYYGIILQIITVSYQVWTSSLQMLFFFEAAMARIAKLSCLAVTAWAPAHGEQYRAVQPCHAWLQVLFFFLRDHFRFLVHLGSSWYIPRSKRQSTTRWSVMIHDVDVADWPCIERSSDGTIPERRRRLIFLYLIRLRWQISD